MVGILSVSLQGSFFQRKKKKTDSDGTGWDGHYVRDYWGAAMNE